MASGSGSRSTRRWSTLSPGNVESANPKPVTFGALAQNGKIAAVAEHATTPAPRHLVLILFASASAVAQGLGAMVRSLAFSLGVHGDARGVALGLAAGVDDRDLLGALRDLDGVPSRTCSSEKPGL